jgi:hypothetical protein
MITTENTEHTEKEAEIRFIDLQLAVATLKPGDRLVISCDRFLSQTASNEIGKLVSQWAPGIPVLVMDGGMKLGVISNG